MHGKAIDHSHLSSRLARPEAGHYLHDQVVRNAHSNKKHNRCPGLYLFSGKSQILVLI